MSRRSERGFALAMAIILAVLYFGLIELLMIDSSRELAEARRFRARIVASTMAENAAELAAHDMALKPPGASSDVTLEDADGKGEGKLRKMNDRFELRGEAETKGLVKTKATVRVTGRLTGGEIYIDYTTHTP